MAATLQPSGLKTLDYGQENWATVMNSNLNIISNFITRVQNLKAAAEPLPLALNYNDAELDGATLVYDKAAAKWKPLKAYTGQYKSGTTSYEVYTCGVKIRTEFE